MKVKNLLIDRAKSFESKPAIIYRDHAITFSELLTNVFSLAKGLSKLGIKKGEKIAIFLPNCPEYIYSYLALFSLGSVVVPLDFMLSEEEIKVFLEHSDTSLLIAKNKKGIDYQRIKNSCPCLSTLILIDEKEPVEFPRSSLACFFWKDIANEDSTPPEQEISDEEHAAIFYTSGSTGHPKGVLLTYGHLDNPVRVITHFLHPTDEDSYLCAGVPFSHIGGLDYMLFMLAFGATLILMDRFHPLEALKAIEKYKARIFCIVPSMFVAILSLKECDKFDLSSLRYAVVFGAPSSPALLKRFHDLCSKASLRNGWGMTETSAPNTYSPHDVKKIHSIGPFGTGMEARIVDEYGQDVAEGERGELWIRGKGVMVGYYKEEALTKEVLTPDGWLKTGDIARKDEDGLYYLMGRKKDMIKVAGEIVFAPDVENFLHRHPKVKDVAIVGIPDEMRGEVPKAYVVVREGENIDVDDLRQYCRENLAHFKIPHHFEFCESLPKNRVGKIDKEALKKVVKRRG